MAPPDADALFVPDGDRFVPTRHTGGPWSPDHQFGGAAAALVATVLERVPTLAPMQVVRVTVDLLRPVPIRPLEVATTIVREGKRVQALEGRITCDGVEVVRASALRFRTGDLSGVELPTGPRRAGPPAVPRKPFGGPRSEVEQPGIAGALQYAGDGEHLFAGPTWVRLVLPVLAGEGTTPLGRLAFVADCVSAVGHPAAYGVRGINADITLNVIRSSEAEWLCLDGDGWTGVGGVGVAQATLSDEDGVVGTAVLSRLVDLSDADGAPWRSQGA